MARCVQWPCGGGLRQIEEDWGGQRRTGVDWGELRQTGADWGRLGWTEANWGRLGRIEADWGGLRRTEADWGGLRQTEADWGGAALPFVSANRFMNATWISFRLLWNEKVHMKLYRTIKRDAAQRKESLCVLPFHRTCPPTHRWRHTWTAGCLPECFTIDSSQTQEACWWMRNEGYFMNVGGHFEGFSKGVKEIYIINKIFEVIPTTMQNCWDTGQKLFTFFLLLQSLLLGFRRTRAKA